MLSLALTFSACTQEPFEISKEPISFSAATDEFIAVYGNPEHLPKLQDNVPVGVFVYTTREMLYHTEHGKLVPDEADIPQSTGDDAYAIIPATNEATTFVDAYINIPSEQTYSEGQNPSLINSFAHAKVVDGKAEFMFSPLNAVIEFGLASDDGSIISSMLIKAPSLVSNNYISGRKSFDFSNAGFSVKENVQSGSSSIRINFPENIQLSSEPIYIPVSVLPFMTYGDGLEVTLYNESGYPFEIGHVLVENDDYCNGGALDVAAAEYVSTMIGNVSKDDFTLPAFVDMCVVENKTGNLMPDQKLNIYSAIGNDISFVQQVITGADGGVKLELIPGNYTAYLAKEDGSDDEIRSVDFTVEPEKTVSVELVYYSYTTEIFHDDFKWITPEMGEGDKLLDYFVVSIDPPKINAGTQANSKIDVADGGSQEIISEIGWDFWQPAPAKPGEQVTWVYLRLGEIQLGKSKGYAQATTPAMTGLKESSNVLLSIVADPFYSVKGTDVTVCKTQLKLIIEGPGSFSSYDTEVKEKITDPIQSGDLSNPQEVPDGEPKTFGSKSYYDFVVYGATSETKFCIRTYDETVQDPEDYAQKQILIDDVKILLGE